LHSRHLLEQQLETELKVRTCSSPYCVLSLHTHTHTHTHMHTHTHTRTRARQELRKTASQQMREVAVSQSEAVRMINDEKVAAERREAHLKVGHACACVRVVVCVHVCVRVGVHVWVCHILCVCIALGGVVGRSGVVQAFQGVQPRLQGL